MTFPHIKYIEDVLPAVDGRKEFTVADRPYGTVINYNVVMPDTFSMNDPIIGAMRRECRGLIFDKKGLIMSRPFHKFFNLGEREETLPENLDFSKSHIVQEKLDGSMVRFIYDEDGNVRLATKMGITDVSIEAEKYLTEDLRNFGEYCLKYYNTPIFEYVGPDNQIVIKYDEPKIILTAVRDNISGEYFDQERMSHMAKYFRIEETAMVYDSVKDIKTYIDMVKGNTTREGDVITFEDGYKVKIKAEQYVLIHNMIDFVNQDRNIVKAILDGNIDDVKANLVTDEQRDIVSAVESEFWLLVNTKIDRLVDRIFTAINRYGGDRKRIALEYVPMLPKRDGQFIFRNLEEESDLNGQVFDFIQKNISTNTKYEEIKEWLRS